MQFPRSGLYAITQTEGSNAEQIIKAVYAALQGGVSIVQYRDKTAIDSVYLGKELLKICQQFNVPLIVNDDPILTKQIGADGVHLGKDDGEFSIARKLLGANAIIGMSCYNDLDRAKAAEAEGANYVAFGRFFASSSKPLAAPADIKTLRDAKNQLSIPIVAIGGILPDNGQQLIAAGADVLAVIGGLFDDNPAQSAQAYLKLFNSL